MKRLRDQMSPASRARYLLWRAGLLGDSVTVALATGDRIVLRHSSQFEIDAAYEVFVGEAYRCPRPLEPASVRRIVDVGANVGYTTVYWARRFPTATFEVFEPHPGHFAVLSRTVALNRLDARVKLHHAAAGCADEVSWLIDAGTASTLKPAANAAEGSQGIAVAVMDFFAAMRGRRIDLLKLDCEGSEYDILMDPRFGELEISNLVLEWHATVRHPAIERELRERLSTLGWNVDATINCVASPPNNLGLLRSGMFWAFNQ